jgi:HEAT repeat protein/putative zinc finger protein
MRCDQIREQLVDYLAGLEGEARAAVEEHVRNCAWCQEDVAMWNRLGSLSEERPSPVLRDRVGAMLAAFEEGRAEVKRPVIPARVAPPVWAVASLLVGVLVGHLLRGNGEMVELRQEMRAMRQTVAVSLLQQSSASERLRGVNASFRLERPEPEVVSALVRTLKGDSSVDVRLAAIDALRRVGQDPSARQGMVEALPQQDSPLVQLALIDLLVDVRERRAAEPLGRLRQDAGTDAAVRQRAEWGLRQLQ